MMNPNLAKGIALVAKAKQQERNLLAAYFELGVWLRDEFDSLGITRAQFCKQADIDRTSFSNYRNLAKTYGTIDNVPVGYSYTAALKVRRAYVKGVALPPAPQPGRPIVNGEVVSTRVEMSRNFMHSAMKAVDVSEYITDEQLADIEDNIGMLRAEATMLLREVRERNDGRKAA